MVYTIAFRLGFLINFIGTPVDFTLASAAEYCCVYSRKVKASHDPNPVRLTSRPRRDKPVRKYYIIHLDMEDVLIQYKILIDWIPVIHQLPQKLFMSLHIWHLEEL